MGFFDSLASYIVPSAYADNQAEPTEDSDKAYGAPHQADDSEPDTGRQEETKSVKSTPKETDAGEGGDDKEDGGDEGAAGGDDEQEDGDDDKAEEGGDDGEEDEDEEEEEEEEEPQDIMPKIQEDCSKTSECAHHKHDYQDCVARVHAKEEGKIHGVKEDCVEEFFHLTHCVNQCAAPKLFRALR